MIRYRGFKGFFIMKKSDDEKWEYLSKYWKRGDVVKFTFSEDDVRYFGDTTIESGLPFSVFKSVVDSFPKSKVVLYVSIDKDIHRVKYYNPEGEKKMTSWHKKEDFYCYIPRKEIR